MRNVRDSYSPIPINKKLEDLDILDFANGCHSDEYLDRLPYLYKVKGVSLRDYFSKHRKEVTESQRDYMKRCDDKIGTFAVEWADIRTGMYLGFIEISYYSTLGSHTGWGRWHADGCPMTREGIVNPPRIAYGFDSSTDSSRSLSKESSQLIKIVMSDLITKFGNWRFLEPKSKRKVFATV